MIKLKDLLGEAAQVFSGGWTKLEDVVLKRGKAQLKNYLDGGYFAEYVFISKSNELSSNELGHTIVYLEKDLTNRGVFIYKCMLKFRSNSSSNERDKHKSITVDTAFSKFHDNPKLITRLLNIAIVAAEHYDKIMKNRRAA